MRIAIHALCAVMLILALSLPSISLATDGQPTKEYVAKSWSWAQDDDAIKNPKNRGKSRKLRKKSAAAAAHEEAQLQAWAMLGDGLCALAGASTCAKGSDVFENSLKSHSNKTVDVLKKEKR